MRPGAWAARWRWRSRQRGAVPRSCACTTCAKRCRRSRPSPRSTGPAMRRRLLHRAQHELVQDLRRHRTLQRAAIHAGSGHDDEVELGHDVDALAAEADTGDPFDLATVYQGAAEPPLVAVEKGATAG